MKKTRYSIQSFLGLCIVAAFAALPMAKSDETPQDNSHQKAGTENYPVTPNDSQIRVVVTATRGSARSELEVPQAIDTMDATTLEDQAFPDIDNALRRLPNFGLAPAEGNPNYWQEGFSIRGLGAQRVLTLTDGIRQAGQGIGYGGGNLSLYDTFGIDRIEVLRGPASVLYGTDAFGGVVNIITREPTRRSEAGANGAARYTYDTARNQHRGGTYVDAGDENNDFVFGVTYTKAGRPDLPNGEDPLNGSYNELSFWGKGDHYTGNGSRIRLIANIDQNRDILVTDSSIPLPIALFPPPGSSELVTSPLYFRFPLYQRSLVGVEYLDENLGGDWDSVRSSLSWQQILREFHRETAFLPTASPGFAGPPLFVDPSATVRRATVDTTDHVNTFEWHTQGAYSPSNHDIVFGLDVALDDANLNEHERQIDVAQAGIGIIPARFFSDENRSRADARQYRSGLYVQDTIELGRWSITPGVRGDMFNVEDSNSDFSDDLGGASGSIGTLYRLTEKQSLYTNVSTGFRAPDLGERFQDGIVNLGVPTRIIGNPDLDSERSWSVESGWKVREGRFSFDTAAFYNYVKDYIFTQGLGPIDGVFTDQYANVGNVTLYGGEASGSLQITDRLSAYGNASKTWTDDAGLVNVPSWVFNYGLEYFLPVYADLLESLSFGVNTRTVRGSTDTITSPGREPFTAGGFTRFDLFVNAELGETSLGSARLLSGITNLFNKAYQEPFFPQNQPRRGYYMGVQFNF